jgi:cardiolipin synthase (CMP-forming)
MLDSRHSSVDNEHDSSAPNEPDGSSYAERPRVPSLGEREPRDPAYRDAIITIPNVICAVRLVSSPGLIALALIDRPIGFVILFTILTVSDWVDGRLARMLHQRSDFGARIDSFADAVLYASMLFGCLWLAADLLANEIGWIAAAVGSYALTCSIGLWKYGRIPSYHTYSAKRTQFLVLVAVIALIVEWSVWPLRLAALAVTWTNLETTCMSLLLPTWRADVSSLGEVLKERKQAADQA